MKNLKSGNVCDDDRSMESERKEARKILMRKRSEREIEVANMLPHHRIPIQSFLCLPAHCTCSNGATSNFILIHFAHSNIRCTFSLLFFSDRFKKSLSAFLDAGANGCDVKPKGDSIHFQDECQLRFMPSVCQEFIILWRISSLYRHAVARLLHSFFSPLVRIIKFVAFHTNNWLLCSRAHLIKHLEFML